MAAQLPAPSVLAQLAKDDRGKPMLIGSIVLTVVASFTVFVRLFAQRLAKGALWYDDYAIVVGWLLALGCTISACLEFHYAAGRHLLTVITTSPDPLYNLMIFLKAGWVLTVLWGQALFWIKLSLLLFYKRIFEVGKSRLAVAIWVVMGYLVCVAIISLFDEIFQCLPVSYFWQVGYAFVGEPLPINGSCPNLVARGVAMAVLNLVSDIFIITLPIFGLWPLQMSKKRKVGLGAVFTLGTLCCVVTIVRIPYLFSSELSKDPPWDNAYAILFTILEPNGGVLCACLPCLAPLLSLRKKRSSYEGAVKQGSDDSHPLGSGKKTSAIDHSEPRSEAGLNQSSYILLDDWESKMGRKYTNVATQREQLEMHRV